MVEYDDAERTLDYVRLRLRGELAGPMQTAQIRRALECAHIDGGIHRIRMDLSGLDFMDTSGIASLVLLYREAAKRGQQLVVEGARGQVREKLRVTGVVDLLTEGN